MQPAPRRTRQSAPPIPVGFDEFAERDAAAKVLQKAAKSPDRRRRQTLPPNAGGGGGGGGGGGSGGGGSGGGRGRMVVGVRLRPLSSKENKRGSHACLAVKEGGQVFATDPDDKMGGLDYLRLDKNKDKAYQFDYAFGPEQSTEEVYDCTVKRVVSAVLDGFHGSCFAYGATGSGKTFTMTGDGSMPGIMPRAIEELFARSTTDHDEYKWCVRAQAARRAA